jgi:hypothetical protein
MDHSPSVATALREEGLVYTLPAAGRKRGASGGLCSRSSLRNRIISQIPRASPQKNKSIPRIALRINLGVMGGISARAAFAAVGPATAA